ncbi:hypothetical protein AAF712_005269 [Marasmius tenuissimus]|uniref:Uncharacterized protein n=1 Tax=Marasmius tenuissimus TaxID=585030 RepID=A0ABR3A3G3_9AGAR
MRTKTTLTSTTKTQTRTKTSSTAKSTTLSTPISPKKPTAQTSTEEYHFTFGKHKGKPLSLVPSSYVDWCVKAGVVDQYPALKNAIEASRGNRNSRTLSSSNSGGPACEDLLFPDRKNPDPWEWDDEDLEQVKARVLVEMEDIVKQDFMRQYPPRPPKANYDEFFAQKDICEATIRIAATTSGAYQKESERDPRIEDCYDAFTGDEDEVAQCLNDVEREAGAKARKVANWLVRDKHAECIGGIEYAGGGKNQCEYSFWRDVSVEWLKHFVDQYPPRPSKAQFDGLEAGTDEETYEAVNKLLEIVEGYPSTEDVETDRRLTLQDNMITGEVWVELTDVFKKEVMKSLEEVEEVAGIGAREIANWMIRDKVDFHSSTAVVMGG